MRQIAAIFLIWALFSQGGFAVPAISAPFEHELPDGSSITVRLHGDEWQNWRTTTDGYTILLNENGFWEYASEDKNGDLQSSGIRAQNENKRTNKEREFLRDRPKNLRGRRLESEIFEMEQIRGVRSILESQEIVPFEGEWTIPVILVGFQGKPFQRTKQDFETLFNGRVRDYFLENSYGKFDLRANVYGPFTLSNPITHYNRFMSSGSLMAREAVNLAIEQGFDYFQYPCPINPDNLIAVHIIFAGYCQAYGAPANDAIWSHAAINTPVFSHNGRWYGRYSCSSELSGISGTNIAPLGTLVHELGHSVFDFRDFYATGSVCPDNWCIMAKGGVINNGNSPSLFSAYPRVRLGWAQEITINSAAQITLPNPTERGVVYRINTQTNGEYFLIENRQRIGFDALIPASGMLIYRVNKNVSAWNNNSPVNTDPANRGYYVMQAGCDRVNGCVSDQGMFVFYSFPRSNDAFPRFIFNSFTDYSVPNARARAGENTNKPITNITHNTTARTISFDFMMTATWNSNTPPVPIDQMTVIISEGASRTLLIPPNATITIIGETDNLFDNSPNSIGIYIPYSSTVIWKAKYAALNTQNLIRGDGRITFTDGGFIVNYDPTSCKLNVLPDTAQLFWNLVPPTGIFYGNDGFLPIANVSARHNFNNWTLSKEPNCTDFGEISRICQICTQTETTPTPERNPENHA
ncbi:MAG: M6 family metalloprotease domain-containing protein, partial [Chitinivibrionia bacterium]|nr:M6 family metalloprotease domain-containing protein [Chitinivibrionia bacterium]